MIGYILGIVGLIGCIVCISKFVSKKWTLWTLGLLVVCAGMLLGGLWLTKDADVKSLGAPGMVELTAKGELVDDKWSSEDMKSFKKIVSAYLTDENSTVKVVSDGSTIIVCEYGDGLAEAVQELKDADSRSANYDKAYATWQELVDNKVDLCLDIWILAIGCDLDNVTVRYLVLNDVNMENVLVAVENGTVVYDCMDE